MLIKGYNPTNLKILNNKESQSHIGCDICVQRKYKNLTYNTTSLNQFDNIPTITLLQLFKEQEDAAIEEANLHLKYSYLTQGTHNKTLEQYKTFFFYQNHAYNKEELKNYIAKQNAYDETFISKPKSQSQNNQQQPPPSIQLTEDEYNEQVNTLRKNNQRGVSRQAIRNITGYTYNPIPEWSVTKISTYIEWQHKLLEDTNKLIIVNGSRQMGKSYTIAEKAIELSFLPNNDTLVGGFTTKTTDIIKKYILRYIKKFPPDTFQHFKSERYIINNKTGTCVYFRTLADDAQSILGMTLKNIIVDEAQLVDEFVYEEVLLPTLSTTGGSLTLILTPGRKRSGYAFKKIMEIKKGLLPNASLYNVDITQNPFIDPDTRANVMARKDEPGIRRQWFCEWNDGGDTLFNFEKTIIFPELSQEGMFVLGKDPARLRDRSGYSLIYIYNGHATIISSGFVPDSHKKDWGLQAKFYKDIIENYQKKHFTKWYNTIDVSGVGDGVAKIFQDAGIRFISKIRYSAGTTETINGTDYRVGKSHLINTTLDMIQEGYIDIYESTNKELLEEISYINQTDTRTGMIAMESSYFDDITNATMIAIYTIAKLGFLNRNPSKEESKGSGSKYIDAIENGKPFNQYEQQLSDVW